ncbi:hypothetical protein M422DRAFT_28718, partial [Sphaerobolus stellatus SS14]
MDILLSAILSILPTKPYLAARLRILELINDQDLLPVFPRSLSMFPEYDKAPDVDQLETKDILVSRLASLISHTTNLTHFICHITSNFCSVFNLLATLQEHSPALQELYLNARNRIYSHQLKLDHKRSTMISLRAVCLVISFRIRSGVDVSELVDFIIGSCPSIVDLRLSFGGR